VIADAEVGDTGVFFEVVPCITRATGIAVLDRTRRITIKDAISADTGIGDAEVSFDMKALITFDAEDIAIGWTGRPFSTNAFLTSTLEG
jgi:hypothetical protein